VVIATNVDGIWKQNNGNIFWQLKFEAINYYVKSCEFHQSCAFMFLHLNFKGAKSKLSLELLQYFALLHATKS
jgi:hypothetical protein